MKYSNRISLIATLVPGFCALGLQLWFLTSLDEKGLLPMRHPGKILLFLLTGLFFLFAFFYSKKSGNSSCYQDFYQKSLVCAVETVLSGLGLIVYSLTSQLIHNGPFGILAAVLGVASGLCMLMMFPVRLKGKAPSYYYLALITIYTLLHTIVCSRIWNAGAQIEQYLFPLLASVFLMLSSFHQAALSQHMNNGRGLLRTSMCAMYCCMVAVTGQESLFFASMGLYTAMNLFSSGKASQEEQS